MDAVAGPLIGSGAFGSEVDYPVDVALDPAIVPFGVDEHGRPVDIALRGGSVLVGGSVTGPGIHPLLAGVSRLEHAVVLSVTSTGELEVVLADVRTEMLSRQLWLEREGLDRFGSEQISAVTPLIVLVLDDIAGLSNPDLIRRIVVDGRDTGIVTVVGATVPTVDMLPQR